jgi:transposase InsO family protein
VSHKPSEAVNTEPGGRLYLDTTGPFTQSAGGTKYNATLVDQASSFGWVTHLKAKSDVPEVLDRKGYKIKKIRCDNAGEHQTSLKKVCERHGADLEYTAPHTPQMNGVVERRIASTGWSTYTMLTGARLKEGPRARLRAEAKTTVNTLRNMYVKKKDNMSPYEKFHNEKPRLQPQHWVEFGRVGYATSRTAIKKKGALRGIPMLCVG